jgi:hypothetical protein
MCLLILYLVNGNIGGKVSSLGIFIELEILLKFIYSEKATKICEIFPLLLTVCTVVKS